MAIIGFSHLSLEVEGVDDAARFFSDLLGMRVVRLMPRRDDVQASGEGAERTASALLVGEGLKLELHSAAIPHAPSGSSRSGAGLDGVRLSFVVDDLASTLHSLCDRGAESVDRPGGEFAAGFALARVRAPGGIVVELVQRPTGVATAFDDFDRR